MTLWHLADLESSLVPAREQQHEHTVQRLPGERRLQGPPRISAVLGARARALLSLPQLPPGGRACLGTGAGASKSLPLARSCTQGLAVDVHLLGTRHELTPVVSHVRRRI